MQNYLSLLQDILDNGIDSDDRTGTGTLSVFGRQLRFDLQKGFPLVTTKKIHLKSVIHELLWMIAGRTDVKYLQDNGVKIWNEWEKEDGTIGPAYGRMWRDANGVDQLQNMIDLLRTDPSSRRMIVDCWQTAYLKDMALTPCHMQFQANVSNGKLSLMVLIRSSDVGLGLPFNIAFYAILTHMLAQITNYEVGDLVVTLGNTHIYKNHIEQIKEQLQREPYPLPTIHFDLKLSENKFIEEIDDFTYDSIMIKDYKHHPRIKMPVSV